MKKWKKRLFYLLLLLCPIILYSRNVGLMWDYVDDPKVAGYLVYYGSVSGGYTNVLDAGNSNFILISNLVSAPNIKYYFAVLCYASNGMKSDLSEEVCLSVPPTPINLKVSK